MTDKPRNSGQWTEARFRQFVISGLRSLTMKWNPKSKAKARARVSRGLYRCEGCNDIGPATLTPLVKGMKRRNNAVVDHIQPVVDPREGFVNWDIYIERLLCEADGYQVLCHECHTRKTANERVMRTQAKRMERSEIA